VGVGEDTEHTHLLTLSSWGDKQGKEAGRPTDQGNKCKKHWSLAFETGDSFRDKDERGESRSRQRDALGVQQSRPITSKRYTYRGQVPDTRVLPLVACG